MIHNPIARFPLNATRIQNTLHSVQETTTCISTPDTTDHLCSESRLWTGTLLGKPIKEWLFLSFGSACNGRNVVFFGGNPYPQAIRSLEALQILSPLFLHNACLFNAFSVG